VTPERRDEIALRVVSVVVVGSVALALAGLTWRLTGWDDGRSQVAVAGTLPPPGGATPGGDADVARIVSLAPFGGAVAADGLPASTLGLVLKGVLMTDPPSASTALIAVGDGPAALYGVGQSVGSAAIESIAVDHVVLTVGGARQRLDFPEPVASIAPAPLAAPPPAAGLTVAPGASPLPEAAATAPGPTAGGRSALAGAVAAPDPAALGVAASAEGYRVGPNPSAELRRFGLQAGDVIESLNGQPLDGDISTQQLIERARSAGQARVVVVRGDRRLNLTFPLR
jgi:general secretion pathway protein C